MRMISGSTAMARAMQRRCCWPPERPSALVCRRSRTSSQSAAPRQAALDRFVEPGLVVDALEAQAVDDVFVDRFREGIRFLEDHADALAQLDHVDGGMVDIDAAKS